MQWKRMVCAYMFLEHICVCVWVMYTSLCGVRSVAIDASSSSSFSLFFLSIFLSFVHYLFLYSFSLIFFVVDCLSSIVYAVSLSQMHWLWCWFSRTVNRHQMHFTVFIKFHLYIPSTNWPSLNGKNEYI